MDFKIQLDKKEKTDWFKEQSLTAEQFKQLILQKVERNKHYSVVTRKQLV
jgi:hypothetical protein